MALNMSHCSPSRGDGEGGEEEEDGKEDKEEVKDKAKRQGRP
jgi:hypothetical protein